MTNRFRGIVAMALSLGVCGFSGGLLAADGDKPAGDPQKRERPAGDRPAPGPRPGGQFGFGRLGFGPGALGEVMTTLSDLNMSPDFTLTKDQKEKIHVIREAYTKEMEKWRGDHEADLKKFQDQMAELRGKGPDDNREKRQELFKAQAEFFSTAPKGEEQAKAIKAVLDPEQLKQYEERVAKRQGERREGGREGGAPGAPRERGPANPTPPREAK